MIGGIIVGLIAGAIAGWIMRGEGYGCLWNIVLGLLGGTVGGWLFERLDITWQGTIGSIGTAVIGAVILIWLYRIITGNKK